ncbi:unnamed protein product [Acanthoscelides obtectus]|uniref:Uncharacterized protein n=1 Tax=Acanthoscelides obtectus TaxID=200917 RepID=A0A9P0KB26_ACAOB|nr:unnamed protein product [Acanthoscelides obtectus]CAK1676818.1 hypothetical protein AOBTE_LOCUS30953 [Acanthoscelides obtectus]
MTSLMTLVALVIRRHWSHLICTSYLLEHLDWTNLLLLLWVLLHPI